MKSIIAMCIVMLAGLPAAQEPPVVISGNSQNDLIGLQTIDKSKSLRDQFDLAGANRLTINLRNANTTSVKIEGSFDLWLLEGAYADAFQRLVGPESFVLMQTQSVLLLDIRKLYVALYFPLVDFSIGRQIISLGQGLVFSPVDVFSSVNIVDLSLQRYGSDVVRIKVPFGDLAGIDAIGKISSRSQGATAAIKGYTHVSSFDLAALGIYRGGVNELLTGFTFKGDLVAGVYGELVEHWCTADNRFFVGMLGADYSIQNDWYFTAEYLFNERPDTTTAQSVFSLVQTNVPLRHHHYGFFNLKYQINDLMSLSANVIADIAAEQGIATGQYSWSVMQNATAILYLQYYPSAILGGGGISDELLYGLRLTIAF